MTARIIDCGDGRQHNTNKIKNVPTRPPWRLPAEIYQAHGALWVSCTEQGSEVATRCTSSAHDKVILLWARIPLTVPGGGKPLRESLNKSEECEQSPASSSWAKLGAHFRSTRAPAAGIYSLPGTYPSYPVYLLGKIIRHHVRLSKG